MTANQDTDDRRRFHRVLFDAPTRVTAGEEEFLTTLVDISLNGALLIRPDSWPVEQGDNVNLIVLLDDSESRIRMNALVAHVGKDSIGLRCLNIDMESVSHLRRLVELNLGDTELLERDLQALG